MTSLRELNHRHEDGLDVTLLWDSEVDRLSILVVDEKYGRSPVTIPVEPADASFAFDHPFVYAS